ncbi:succinate dehydrogenase/fumarate reductase iron-sulfur subunit [Opitutales bacterium]|jgi:succinate dehydrogenase / fumarate reductase iron-sulfur subunit|uniref:succinate dehydrogenase/fumarate reductase iron-sulfur subunit n=1 Tax=Candidatus Seribacter sulfatis TaxID=3381756 RepID=UPI00230D56C5|nr:succinate dehydrogenase/fumarate reductase iron-sulfur subunit [Opitutales bacterium]MDC1006236.1 succinate dehydrogenase/fumarate reductase iron-sulfur subunit [Opitutales bacterium]MDC1309843.1 succinate dehydrogenase/fumarate reductase iron-sulfur subunit [Opitutales bacterium]
MKLTLKIWRQTGPTENGSFESHVLDDVSEDSSFLEMLDQLNEQLLKQGNEPIAFDHDCREGICGTCSLTINGYAHGPENSTTTCQLHMRKFNDGETVTIEPFRAKAFPVVRDLIVDRSAFDRIIQSGGFISVRTGSAPDGNSIPISKVDADKAMDAAACIGCGACVASCKNASAMLFTSAKAAHLNLLPQGQAEKDARVLNMVSTMDDSGFGNCRNYGECSAACPKDISLDYIAKLNRDHAKAKIKEIFS